MLAIVHAMYIPTVTCSLDDRTCSQCLCTVGTGTITERTPCGCQHYCEACAKYLMRRVPSLLMQNAMLVTGMEKLTTAEQAMLMKTSPMHLDEIICTTCMDPIGVRIGTPEDFAREQITEKGHIPAARPSEDVIAAFTEYFNTVLQKSMEDLVEFAAKIRAAELEKDLA